MENLAKTVAAELWEAAASGQAIAPIRGRVSDIDLAYEIQQLNNERKIAAGARPIGAKIGLTSPAVQQQLGVDQPDYGLLLTGMDIQDGGALPYDQLMQPKAEAEMAFVLGADIDALESTNPLDPIEKDGETVAAAVAYISPSIEIVGSRIADWNIRITDTVADNASASHFVLGKEQIALSELDLPACEMSLQKNGETVSTGNGAACMGSPLNAAVWLARTMLGRGRPLKAGEIILTGALGPMVPLEKGDEVRAEISGLGSVSISIQ